MNPNDIIIIDFDSTFVQTETFDELIDHTYSDAVKQQITELTDCAMTGKINFKDALKQRIQLLSIERGAVNNAISTLSHKITVSFEKNTTFIQAHAKQIYIISGGFSEIIEPIVAPFGITHSHIWANEFVYDNDHVIGINETLNLAQDHGKCKQLKSLSLKGKVYVIGDGYTDYEMKETGLVNKFYLFTENVKRESLLPLADKVISSFDEFIQDINHATNE